MIEDRKTSKGFRVIDLTMEQLQKLGSICPVCDNCNTPVLEGATFIGVLGSRAYCQTCFDEWHKTAINYPEDRPYENRVTDRILKILNL